MKDTEEALRLMCEALGLKFRSATRDTASAETTVHVALPYWSGRVVIDEYPLVVGGASGAEYLLKTFESAQRTLHRDAIAHIAAHDKSPHERLEQIETAAKKLVDLVRKLEASASVAVAAPVLNAAFELEALVKAKPGGLNWRPELAK